MCSSRGLHRQAPASPVVHFYAAQVAYFYAVVDRAASNASFCRREMYSGDPESAPPREAVIRNEFAEFRLLTHRRQTDRKRVMSAQVSPEQTLGHGAREDSS